MNARILAGLLPCLLVACGGGSGDGTPGWVRDGTRARYADPVEKARLKTSSGKPSVDLRTVEVDSDAGVLRVTATFHDAWDACFDADDLGDVVFEMWIDTDADAATGGVLLGGTAKGFEVCVTPVVGSEIDFSRTPPKVTGMSASYGVKAFRQGEDEFAVGRRTTLDELKAGKARQDESRTRCRVGGSDLAMSVPYEQLGARAGQSLRIVFMERYGTTFNAESLCPELTMALR